MVLKALVENSRRMPYQEHDDPTWNNRYIAEMGGNRIWLKKKIQINIR